MDRRRSPATVRLISAGLSAGLAAALWSAGVGTAQSPDVSPAVQASASASAFAASPAPLMGGIEWKISKKGKDFDKAITHELAIGSDGRVILVGATQISGDTVEKGAAWASTDGKKWTRLKGKMPKGSEVLSIASTETGFVLVGHDGSGGGRIWTSDGTSLTPIDGPDGVFQGVERGPLGIHMSGVRDGQTLAWNSADGGTTWTESPLADTSGEATYVASTSLGAIVVVGSLKVGETSATPIAWSSTDGLTWTATPLPIEPGLWVVRDLEQTPVGLVALVQDLGGGKGTALLSQDGVTWTPVIEDESPLRGIGTLGAEAIVYGADRWYHSPDGVTWTRTEEPGFEDFKIVGSVPRPDGTVVAVGYGFPTMDDFYQTNDVATWIGTPTGG